MPKRFTKKKENFTCEHCGAKVEGNGYTNHCPRCLWSKHVDINPGDREDECGGMMKPVDIYLQKQDWIIIHECGLCRQRSKNKILPEDDFDEVVRLEKEINDKKIRKGIL